MTLEINKSYPTDTGYIIPRSHFDVEAMPTYAVFEICEQIGNRYVVRHKPLTKKECKKLLHLPQNERLEIV